PEGTRLEVLSPVVQGRKGEHRALLEELRRSGFLRIRVDGEMRELEEETGHRAGRLAPLTRIFTTPGFTDEVIRLFVAWDLTPGETRLDRDEFVEVVRVPFSRAVAWVRDGTIEDCKSVATILYAAQFVVGRGVAEEPGVTP
ncbi:MAG: hypothetical protein RQ751_09490, partial [Longimicrobiales bacterium]|nr:hypothetical protein [Longimicrobiales bacterium]